MGKERSILHKAAALVMACVLAAMVLLLPGCSGGGKSTGTGEASTTFSYWIGQGEDSSYYNSYRENPAIDYILSKSWPSAGGEEVRIDLDFVVPVSGSQQDNFNTLIATGEYTDIMEMTYYSGSIAELYEEGTILDLTYWVENYMPNYVAFLDAHPDLKMTATNLVDGELKYIQLYNYSDATPAWGGYNYRRDWIIQYGVNPFDGSSFSGSYGDRDPSGAWDADGWSDNVVFPSGETNPIYISDWEWMFEIFETAMEDLGITDGYCMSLYYPGYMSIGDLVSAFGGTGGHWYLNQNGNVEFGATGENFRTYLQAMNTWYEKGWIDKAFAEHSSDIFYRIDDTKVRQGKIGLWYGVQGMRPASLDTGSDYTEGMLVYPARQPINDIYGTDAQQGVVPYTFYQQGFEATSICISDKAADKDLEALFSFLDYMCTVEGSLLATMGLSKEQYEETQDEFYTQQGLTDGAYFEVDTADGPRIRWVDKIRDDGGSLMNAVCAKRIFATDYWSIKVEANPPEWLVYLSTGNFANSFTNQVSAEDAKTFTKIENNITEFLSKNVPGFINGSKDPFDDADWEAFVNAVNKYEPEKNTEIYQNLYDQLSQ